MASLSCFISSFSNASATSVSHNSFLSSSNSGTTVPKQFIFSKNEKSYKRSSTLPVSMKGVTFSSLDGSNLRIGVVHTRWNLQYVDPLVNKVKEGLKECKVKDENVIMLDVPGSFELPFAVRTFLLTQKLDAIIAIGVLIKGETSHYEYIAESVSSGLMDLQLSLGFPVIFGVLTCLTEDQVKERSIGSMNHGADWAKSAVEMGLFRKSQTGEGKEKKSVGFF